MRSCRTFVWSLTLVVLACSDGAEPSDFVTEVRVSFDPQTPEGIVLPDQSYQLRVFAYDSAYEWIPGLGADSWGSSNPSVATISATGIVTGHAPGFSDITARVGSVTGGFQLYVSPPVASVTILADTTSTEAAPMVPGGTLELRALLADAQAQVLEPRRVEWSVAHASPGVLTVTENGRVLVTAPSAGSVTVYATREGVTDSLLISVQPVSYTKVTSGSAFTCGLTAEGVAWCWGGGGGNQYGQLGRTLGYLERTPAAVETDLRFRLLAAGAAYVCGLVTSGQAYCWGSNHSGQLGDGTTTDRPRPVAVAGGVVFDTLVAGDQVACGLTADGIGYCWGGTAAGESGTGGNGLVPAAIAGGHRFTILATSQKSLQYGQVHTCGIDDSGAAWCWGTGDFGQLGDSTQVGKATPVRVRGGHTFVEIAAGGLFTCGRRIDNKVLCWGFNGRYAIAAPLDSSIVVVPRLVQGVEGVTRLQSGAIHTCVLDAGGQGTCWGDNVQSQLGSGVENPYPYAILPMAGGHSFTMMEAGDAHTCGITTLGRTLCWGTMGGNTPTPVIGQP